MGLIQGQVPPLHPAFPISNRQPHSLTWRNSVTSATISHGTQRAWVLTYALWVTACPGAIDRAVPAEQSCGVVAFPTFVDDRAGENQAITEHDSGIAWSSRVPARDH